MDLERISALLEPFVGAQSLSTLTAEQLDQISNYLDLLVRWNSKINLTSVREPEEIITRHFGESFFAARHLFASDQLQAMQARLFDFGSGAGFPGLPIKIWAPQVELTLIESNLKKTTFLREVVRKLALTSAEVFSGRAENLGKQADTVTLRAVERFETSVRIAAGMVEPSGRLALLIGESQIMQVRKFLPKFQWQQPLQIPLSSNRVLLIAENHPNQIS